MGLGCEGRPEGLGVQQLPRQGFLEPPQAGPGLTLMGADSLGPVS